MQKQELPAQDARGSADPTEAAEAEREIVIVRELAAPRALVFAAFTSPEHLPRWWGPKGQSTTTRSMDLREGGAWRFVMHGPEGQSWDNRMTFREITPLDRIAYRMDADVDDDPQAFESTVTFEDLGERTRVTLRSLFATAEQRAFVVGFGAIELGRSSLDELAAHVDALGPKLLVLDLERRLRAPRERVFEAWTRAEHFAQWFGPHGTALDPCIVEARAGGTIRFCHRHANGMNVWLQGAFDEVSAPERLVFTLAFSDENERERAHPGFPDWPEGARSRTTVTLEDGGEGETVMRVRQEVLPAEVALLPTVAKERALARLGWEETLARLGEHVA